MPTTREQALEGLFLLLQDGIKNTKVLRNEVVPIKIPKSGLIILRDGNPGEASITFSPTRYHYNHKAEIEIFTQQPNSTLLDDLLQAVGQVLSSTTNLEGAVDYMYFEAPEFLTERIEGAPEIKAASVPVILEYTTNNPLS